MLHSPAEQNSNDHLERLFWGGAALYPHALCTGQRCTSDFGFNFDVVCTLQQHCPAWLILLYLSCLHAEFHFVERSTAGGWRKSGGGSLMEKQGCGRDGTAVIPLGDKTDQVEGALRT